MNYPESEKILKKVKDSEKILVNCHRSPDPDSVGSALSLYKVLTDLGKEVQVICPDDVDERFSFLANFEKIKRVDYSSFDFSSFDLFITLDSGSWNMVTGRPDAELFEMDIVVIDHHKSNTKYGEINLVDEEISSCAELLYLIFEDWGVSVDKDISTALLTGILGDTGVFRYPAVTPQTMDVARDLMNKGADKDEIIFKVFGSIDMNLLKFWGKVLENSEYDEKYRFFWSATPYKTYEEFGKPEGGKETAASSFAQIVDETDFGIVMVEDRPGVLSISFRSRTGFDVSEIAERLGGGGHKAAAGAKVEGMEFDEAVERVLKEARSLAGDN